MPMHRHLEERVTSLAIQAAFCARALTMLNLYLLVTLVDELSLWAGLDLYGNARIG